MTCNCNTFTVADQDVTLEREIICHGCVHRVDATCDLSGKPTDLHIEGKPCPADLYPKPDGTCNHLGTKTIGVPKLLRWYARTTIGNVTGSLPGCGCFVTLHRCWQRFTMLFARQS